jgi:hypothetical protein
MCMTPTDVANNEKFIHMTLQYNLCNDPFHIDDRKCTSIGFS